MASLNVAQVLTDVDLGITAGLTDIIHATIGGRTVLYALNRAEGRLHEIAVGADGALSVVDELTLGGTFIVGSEPALALSATAGGPALMISGQTATSGGFVTLGPTGSLGTQIAEPVFGELAAPVLLQLDRDDGIVNGRQDGGLDLYIAGAGGFQYADSVLDTSDTYLADVAGGLAVIDAASPFVAVASASESGVSVVRMNVAGSMSLASSFGATEGLPISTPSDLVALSNGGANRLVLSTSGTSSLTVLRIDDDGGLWLEDHVLDSQATRFQSVTSIDALTVGDHAFVAAGGGDGGVSLFTLLPNGRLVHLGSVVDTAATTLYRVSAISLSATSATLSLAATSQWEAGITRLAYDLTSLGFVLILDEGDPSTGTSGDDQIIGTDLSDTVAGGAGDDILFDGAGQDLLIGGAGADLFVFAADGVRDRIEGYEPGVDRLDLSAFDFLGAASQLSVTPTSDGALVVFGEEEIEVASASGGPLSEADFNTEGVLNLDRPSSLKIAQTLTGDLSDNSLNGGQGDDTISGGGGADWLTGSDGLDLIYGDDGGDSIDGGAGADTLDGGAGLDTIAGGAGDDSILGGAGSDLIYGDDFDWSNLA